MSHFVVLKELRRGRAIVHDPALGEVSLDVKSLTAHFTGVALELRPTPAFTKKEETRSLHLSDLWTYSEGFGRSFSQLLVLSLLLQVFALALPFYTQLFIDDVLVNQDFSLLQVMEQKGLVGHRASGKVYSYFAKVRREPTVRALARGFLDRVFDGAVDEYLVHALEYRRPTDDEIRRLEALIAQAKQARSATRHKRREDSP
jgi:hypothetical protein